MQQAKVVESDAQLEALNDQGWAVVNENGRVSMARYEEDCEESGRERLVRYSFLDFERLYVERHHESGKPLGKAWLEWPGRRQYDRVVFRPDWNSNVTPPRVLNLWRGLAVKPCPGSFERIDAHLLDVVCRGDWEHFDYLFHWMARLVQNPGARGETVIALRGKEGAGKSVVGLILRKIIGQHALAISSTNHLTGNFNAHLRDCVFLDCAEAFFAGDHRVSSALKALVTDDKIAIEGKGKDVVQAVNRLSIMMTSNEDWVLPAGPESRRYFVLDVSDEHCGDREYFRALFEEVNDPEALGALLFDLMAMDLSTWNHRHVPVTEALREQRERSLTGVLAWALDLVGREGIVRTHAGSMPWRSFFATSELYNDYAEWARVQRFERVLARETFGREMRKLGLRWQRRALASQGVPAQAEGATGFQMPETVQDFETLVRRAAGVLDEEDEGQEQAA